MQYGYKYESIRIHVLSLFLSHSFSFIYIYPLTITDTYSLTHLPTNEEGHRHHGRPGPERRRRLASGIERNERVPVCFATSRNIEPFGGITDPVSTCLNRSQPRCDSPWRSMEFSMCRRDCHRAFGSTVSERSRERRLGQLSLRSLFCIRSHAKASCTELAPQWVRNTNVEGCARTPC